MNRYTNITPSKFNPLSLQEQMMIPLAKQKKHDNALASIEQNGIFDVNRLDVDNENISNEIQEMQSQFNKAEDEIMSKGVGRGTTKQLLNLKRQKDNFMSNDGNGGKAQNAYKAYQENVKAIQSNNRINNQDKQAYLDHALKQYEGVDKGSYNAYYGANSQDYSEEAYKIGSRMTPQVIQKVLSEQGIIRKTENLTHEDIAETIYSEMLNNRELSEYSNAIEESTNTGLLKNYKQSALNAATAYMKNNQLDSPYGSTKGSGKKTKLKEDGLTSTGNNYMVKANHYIKEGSFFGDDMIEGYANTRKQWNVEIAEAEALGDNTKSLELRKKLYNADYALQLSSQYAKKQLGLDKNFKLNDSVNQNNIPDAVQRMIDGNKQQGIDSEINLKSKISESNIITLINRGLNDNDVEDGELFLNTGTGDSDENYYIFEKGADSDIYRGSMSKKGYKNNLKKINEKQKDFLKTGELIPLNDVNVVSNNATETNKSIKNINEITYSMLKGLDVNSLMGDDKALGKLVKTSSNSQDTKFRGFTSSAETGEAYMMIEVSSTLRNKSSETPFGSDDFDNIIRVPLKGLTQGGYLPSATSALLNKIQSVSDDKTVAAIADLKGTMLTKYIIPNNSKNSNGEVKHSKTTSNEFKRILNHVNKQGKGKSDKLPILKKLRNAEDVSIVTNNFKNKNYNPKTLSDDTPEYDIPEGYYGLSYVDKGEEGSNYFSIKDHMQSTALFLQKNGFNDKESVKAAYNMLLEDISNGDIYSPGENVGFDKLMSKPFITKNKVDLIDFN